ncbi:hypothetical protein NHP164001_18480 [Helicobacter trogontum]|uniref:Uncharacterized protein n=1 Tax=Helicobacter trogontum TaxID=50960 RepID=A0ABQ0D645_9HELI
MEHHRNNPNEILTIPHGNTQEALIKAFPHEAEGIRKYFKKIDFQGYLVRRFPFDMKFLDFFFAPLTTLVFFAYNMLRNESVGKVLDSCIKDPRLKRILNINISYYHHNPFKFIWSYHAIAQSNYYNKGVYIKGGSQKLSDTLNDIITQNDGEVRANADVVEILLENKKAKGVKYIDKKSKEEIEIYADTIIANRDPHIVYIKLLSLLSPNEYKKDSKLTQDFITYFIACIFVYDI